MPGSRGGCEPLRDSARRVPDEITGRLAPGVCAPVAAQANEQYTIVEAAHQPRTAIVVDLVDHTVDPQGLAAERHHFIHERQPAQATLRVQRGTDGYERLDLHAVADHEQVAEEMTRNPAPPDAPRRHSAARNCGFRAALIKGEEQVRFASLDSPLTFLSRRAGAGKPTDGQRR